MHAQRKYSNFTLAFITIPAATLSASDPLQIPGFIFVTKLICGMFLREGELCFPSFQFAIAPLRATHFTRPIPFDLFTVKEVPHLTCAPSR
jgi:hypothetical protein